MLVKRYHAKDMQQAMDTVIKELGSDAVILNSRKVRKKGIKNLFRKPVLEVMVAYDPANVPAVKKLNFSQSAQSADKVRKEQEKAAGTVSREQLERLDRRIDSLDTMLGDFFEKFSLVKRDITYDYPEDVQDILQEMIDNQVREELAHSLAKQAEVMLRKQPGTSAAEVLEHLILEQLGRPEPILHKKFTQKVILVLGPTGVGKTTTIVKLAADFSVKQKKKTGIINTDTFRIGAQEQLQTYADIMGIPLQVVYRSDELEEAMESMSGRDIIFVDTAGKRPGDVQHKEDILDIIRILKPEDVLLCLAATTGFAAIKEMIDTYAFLDKYKLLITKLDETKYRGPLLNISWYSQKPLAYVTTGQNVPDDIEVVDIESIAKQLIRGQRTDRAQYGVRDTKSVPKGSWDGNGRQKDDDGWWTDSEGSDIDNAEDDDEETWVSGGRQKDDGGQRMDREQPVIRKAEFRVEGAQGAGGQWTVGSGQEMQVASGQVSKVARGKVSGAKKSGSAAARQRIDIQVGD